MIECKIQKQWLKIKKDFHPLKCVLTTWKNIGTKMFAKKFTILNFTVDYCNKILIHFSHKNSQTPSASMFM